MSPLKRVLDAFGVSSQQDVTSKSRQLSSAQSRSRRSGRKLRLESLENRRVLASLVTLEIVGDELIVRDSSADSDSIRIFQNTTRGNSPSDSFTIQAVGDTQLRFGGNNLEGDFNTADNAVINNISIDFSVFGGADSIEFVGRDQGASPSIIDEVLKIRTNGASTVSLDNVQVNQLAISNIANNAMTSVTLNDVVVREDVAAVGADLNDIAGNAVAGGRDIFPTTITSAGGGSIVSIVGSDLGGGLSIYNDGLLTDPFEATAAFNQTATSGMDMISIQDTSIGRLAARPTNAPPPTGGGGVVLPSGYLPTVFAINNGDGDSTLMLASTVATSTMTVFGDIEITNGVGFDRNDFSGIDVHGGVTITNGNGSMVNTDGSSTIVRNGTQIGMNMNDGSGLVVNNMSGEDELDIVEAILLNGVIVDNLVGSAGGDNTVRIGQETITEGGATRDAARTEIGGNTLFGNAVQIINGDDEDSVDVTNATLSGLVDIGLGAGEINSVNFSNVRIVGNLNIGNTTFITNFLAAANGGNGTMGDRLGLTGQADTSAGVGTTEVTLVNTVVVGGGTYINLGEDSDLLTLGDGTVLGTSYLLEGGMGQADLLVNSGGVNLSLPGGVTGFGLG